MFYLIDDALKRVYGYDLCSVQSEEPLDVHDLSVRLCLFFYIH